MYKEVLPKSYHCTVSVVNKKYLTLKLFLKVYGGVIIFLLFFVFQIFSIDIEISQIQ